MIYEIKWDDNCKIRYCAFDVRLRSYNFEYTTFHGMKHEYSYEVFLAHVDCKNMFKVASCMGELTYFNTYDEAEAYIFKQFSELKSRIQIEEEEIKTYLSTDNKKKRGSKKST